MALILFIVLFRYLFKQRKNIAAELFAEALRTENGGNIEGAIITYENALQQFEKNRFRDDSLKNRIQAKIKVLHSLIDYRNNVKFIRK